MHEILKKFTNWHIVMVGCGGTGSNLVPHLAQLIYSLKSEKISLILADQDIVEPDNIGRQLFIEPETGENKAGVLQMRYYTAWGGNISYHPYYITEESVLMKLLNPENIHKNMPAMPVLLGCVDNNFSRRVFDRAFGQSENLIYLDAGNSEFVGQVVLGFRYKGATILRPVAEYFPEILTDQ
ncbi:MAG: ThiF family adenylyltransferase, partial [Firmicutes bacterium]|nr:ThiF family adenylyltransferase [Bacillota bacterium]